MLIGGRAASRDCENQPTKKDNKTTLCDRERDVLSNANVMVGRNRAPNTKRASNSTALHSRILCLALLSNHSRREELDTGAAVRS